MKQTQGITKVEYLAFQEAYDFFNTELFGSSLPHVLVTLQRHARSKGYFAPERFSGRVEPIKAHELALNPDGFTGSTDEDILSTLAHEWCMCGSKHTVNRGEADGTTENGPQR